MTVTFLVKIGKMPTPENQVESYGADYMAEGEKWKPKCVLPDGAIIALPENGIIPLSHALLFVDVPESGYLTPTPHSPLGGGVKREFLDPAIDGMEYLVDFYTPIAAIASVSEGVVGCVCKSCKGIGWSWEE